jgi:transcriptional regulator GlxA family with amidase domain
MEALDLTGPLAVFGGANRLCREAGRTAVPYRIEVLARRPGPIATSDGLRVIPDRRYTDVRGGIVARALVLFLRRPGGQSQFSAMLASQSAARTPIRDLQLWIMDHLDADLSIPALAARVAMSPRNFARVFTREAGVTPAQFVTRLRVEAACRRLQESDAGVKAIAAACGFGTSETLRVAFMRALGIPPVAYRLRFRGAAAA